MARKRQNEREREKEGERQTDRGRERERESRNRGGDWNGKNHNRTEGEQDKPERKGIEQKLKSNISEKHTRHEEWNARRTDAQKNGSKTERKKWRV